MQNSNCERTESARSGLTSAPENDHPADVTLLAKLQQTATLANENCDRATALVRKLSAELRDAQQRIRDLEREAKGRLETEAALVFHNVTVFLANDL